MMMMVLLTCDQKLASLVLHTRQLKGDNEILRVAEFRYMKLETRWKQAQTSTNVRPLEKLIGYVGTRTISNIRYYFNLRTIRR